MSAIHPQGAREKALRVNLDDSKYGTFAEIGAGQEVVRWFFQAGAAAGTISKSISAYDMQVSDAIYGECQRYVARERLEAMLETEYRLNVQRLSAQRGEKTAFFAFADTVAARNFQGTNKCHAWMGIKFQANPGDEASQIIVHCNLLDPINALQQHTLGVVGVNLIYGATFLYQNPSELLNSLMDGLTRQQIEFDMVEFSGAAFRNTDNREMSVRLVQQGLADATLFGADGSVLQACDFLRKKSVVLHRGRFRPLTHVNDDILRSTTEQFTGDFPQEQPIALLEMTMQDLASNSQVDFDDFIARAEVLSATGHSILISNFSHYRRLAYYLRNAGVRRTALAMGLQEFADLVHGDPIDEGEDGHDLNVLSAVAKLVGTDLSIYVYPLVDEASGTLCQLDSIKLTANQAHLLEYLKACNAVQDNRGFNREILHIKSPDVLQAIAANDDCWEEMVPDNVAEIIKSRQLFR